MVEYSTTGNPPPRSLVESLQGRIAELDALRLEVADALDGLIPAGEGDAAVLWECVRRLRRGRVGVEPIPTTGSDFQEAFYP
jgi:hypothetical protein